MINRFCYKMFELFKCPNYIEWEFVDSEYNHSYNCTSCMLQGQSYNIDKIANNCPFKERFTEREESDVGENGFNSI